MTRTQIVDLLCVAPETVKDWERRGLLHPQLSTSHGKTAKAVKVYDPIELANLPQYKRHMAERSHALDPGELTARAFEMFEDGKSIKHVVMELRITVGVAETLHEDWLDLGKRKSPLAELEKAGES